MRPLGRFNIFVCHFASAVSIAFESCRMSYTILSYTDFPLQTAQKKYDKVLKALQQGDFKTADVRKMQNTGYYRARLDREARLLFKFVRYNGETFLLLLEVLPHHEYDKSRFLRGAQPDEAAWMPLANAAQLKPEDAEEVRYLSPAHKTLHFLEKFISFDEDQNHILHLPVPLIIIGSAGSGKTALTLERLKLLKGNIAYVSLSPFLVENAETLYYAQGYENEKQEIDFLSFRDYLAGLRIPEGKEIDFRAFEGFYNRHRGQTKIKEPYKLYEEFKGVITGSITDKPYLSAEDYQELGIRQSVFSKEQRPEVYDLFKKYLKFLEQEGFYDTNLLSHAYLEKVQPIYDYLIVDEVQDLTNIQLRLILKSLKNPVGFVLAGDANQIVHPNFFSWSALKSMFYQDGKGTDIIHILRTNYRNTSAVTNLANRLLEIKNLRFGSIDRESTYLIRTVSEAEGAVSFLEDKADVKEELNRKTRNSTQFAVLVMNNEDKAAARKFFNTPLIFSIQEAKGLEYQNIILLNFISDHDKEFRIVAEDISPEDLTGELVYARNRDKSNRELDTYKFYVNSLYVAMTRAVKNLFVIESARKHPMLQLLGLASVKEKLAIKEEQSSLADWKKEARRLAQQGKQEQSDAINRIIAQQENKIVLSAEELEQLKTEALDPLHFNNQAKKKLFQYAVSADDTALINQLEALKFPEARKYVEKRERDFNQFVADVRTEKLDDKNRYLQQYGANFTSRTGIHGVFVAIDSEATKSLKYLLQNGASRTAKNAEGLMPIQFAIRQYSVETAMVAYYKQQGKTIKPAHNISLFGRVYDTLKTNSLTTISGDRQFKISSHTMEYFLLNFMAGMMEHIRTVKTANARRRLENIDPKWVEPLMEQKLREIALGLSMDDIMTFIAALPNAVLPEYRRKRNYVNSILAKNEVNRDDPYNRKLFKRTARGIYIVNPDLQLMSY